MSFEASTCTKSGAAGVNECRCTLSIALDEQQSSAICNRNGSPNFQVAKLEIGGYWCGHADHDETRSSED